MIVGGNAPPTGSSRFSSRVLTALLGCLDDEADAVRRAAVRGEGLGLGGWLMVSNDGHDT